MAKDVIDSLEKPEEIDTGYQYDTIFPRQKISYEKKDDDWRKKCIDASIHLSTLNYNTRRSTRVQKQKNYDLYGGKLNMQDLQYAINPLGIEVSNMTFPATVQPYDVWTPIFMELFGEEARRPFSFIVRALNEDAISEKQDSLKKMVQQRISEILTQTKEDQTQQGSTEEQLTALDKSRMSYQDMRETVATRILTYLKHDLNLEMIFSKGWEDALIAGEEIYAIEEISHEPKVRRVNPLEATFVLPHNSDNVDESEIVMELTYMSISQIIDTFYESLTDEEITHIETTPPAGAQSYQIYSDVIIYEKGFMPEFMSESSPVYDARGNIRVAKVTWKSKKKIGCLYFVNPQTEEQEETIVSEAYKPVKGETVVWKWINEYWEGYKIGSDMYKEIKPKSLQFRRMDNLSSCKSGYVGSVYNANNTRSMSLMDRLRPFIHLYCITFYNTELAMATNLGKIALIDTALIPDGWEVDKWLHYARIMKIAFVNSFNEGKKGQATGKLAGNTNQNRELNLEAGNYIQQHISILAFLEEKIADLAGVPRQRRGDMQASDAVGTTDHALNQASYVTEKWFQVHNYTKQRVLEALVETAKKAWDGKSKKLQYITDEMTSSFIDVDMNEFINSEFGVFVTNAAKDQEVLKTMQQLMQAALQNDKATLASVVDILNSESISVLRQKLVDADNQFHQRQQQMEELKNKPILEATQIKDKLERDKMDNDNMNKQLDREANIQEAEIKALGMVEAKQGADLNANGIPDVIDLGKLSLEERKHDWQRIKEQKQLNLEQAKIDAENKRTTLELQQAALDRQHEKTLQAKDHKIDLKEIAAKKIIAKSRPKPTKK